MSTRYLEPEERAARSNPTRALAELLAADPRCAWCGLDLAALGHRRERVARGGAMAWVEGHYGRGPACPDHWRRWDAASPALRALGFTRPRGALASLDHRRPLWEGGTDEPANLQALCQPCHARKTAREAGQRARWRRRERRGIKHDLPTSRLGAGPRRLLELLVSHPGCPTVVLERFAPDLRVRPALFVLLEAGLVICFDGLWLLTEIGREVYERQQPVGRSIATG